MDQSGVLPIGKIVGVHGMKGCLKVVFFDGEGSDLLAPGRTLTLRTAAAELREVKVEGLQAHKQIIRLTVEGVDHRTAAEALTGADILINRADLPEPEAGRWYWCDLIGLSVYDVDGGYLGRILNLFETGSNDVMVVKNDGAEILIPVLDSVIRRVDLEEKTMIVRLPEGL